MLLCDVNNVMGATVVFTEVAVIKEQYNLVLTTALMKQMYIIALSKPVILPDCTGPMPRQICW